MHTLSIRRSALSLLLGGALLLPPGVHAFYDPHVRGTDVRASDELEQRLWAETALLKGPLLQSGRTPVVLRLERSVQAHFRREFPELAPVFRIYVYDEPELSVITTPGGDMFISTGLLLRVRSPEELTAIMAREIAHVVNRDAARTLSYAKLGSNLKEIFSTTFAAYNVASGLVSATSLVSSFSGLSPESILSKLQLSPEKLLEGGGKAFADYLKKSVEDSIRESLKDFGRNFAGFAVHRLSVQAVAALIKTSVFGYSERLEGQADEFALRYLQARYGNTDAYASLMQRLLDQARVRSLSYLTFYGNVARMEARLKAQVEFKPEPGLAPDNDLTVRMALQAQSVGALVGARDVPSVLTLEPPVGASIGTPELAPRNVPELLPVPAQQEAASSEPELPSSVPDKEGADAEAGDDTPEFVDPAAVAAVPESSATSVALPVTAAESASTAVEPAAAAADYPATAVEPAATVVVPAPSAAESAVQPSPGVPAETVPPVLTDAVPSVPAADVPAGPIGSQALETQPVEGLTAPVTDASVNGAGGANDSATSGIVPKAPATAEPGQEVAKPLDIQAVPEPELGFMEALAMAMPELLAREARDSETSRFLHLLKQPLPAPLVWPDRINLLQAELLLKRDAPGDLPQAVALLSLHVDAHPEDWQSAKLAANGYFRLKDYETALMFYDKALQTVGTERDRTFLTQARDRAARRLEQGQSKK